MTNSLGIEVGTDPIERARADIVGRSDTGYAHRNKRDCCESAILKAQDDSVQRCRLTGGFPDFRFRSSSARGKCKWERQRDPYGRTVYRCTATASVRCR